MTITHSKTCCHCKLEKFIGDFHKSAKAKDGLASWCKGCANAISRSSRKRNYKPSDKRKWQLKTRYGLTPEAVDEMLISQSHKCAICHVVLGRFHIDHCHNTGIVRGLLCHRCNIRLGGWDEIVWRNAALNYLGIIP